MTRALAAMLLATALVAAPAAADVLCRTRKGGVFLRPTCRKREKRVELPRGPGGDAGGPAPAPVRVVDSTGKPVGLFADPFNEDNDTIVVFEAGNRLISLLVRSTGLGSGGPAMTSAHVKPDCSDPPLVFSLPIPLVRSGVVFGDAVYYAEDPIATQKPVASEFPPGPTGCGIPSVKLPNGNCCVAQVYGTFHYGILTKAFDLSTLGLTPPFHLEP